MDKCMYIFKHGNDKYIAPASSIESFASLVKYVSTKWKELDGSTVVYHYSVGRHVGCKFDCQLDYDALLWLITRDSAVEVDIVVQGKLSCTSSTIYEQQPIEHQKYVSVEKDILDTEPAFFVHRENNLLSRDWPSILGDVGSCFPGGFPQLRNAIAKYQCETGYLTKASHNNHSKYGAHCLYRKTKGCLWWIYASISSKDGLLYVKSFKNVHTCYTPERRMVTSRMTSGLVKDLIIDEARSRLDMRPKEVIHRLRESYGFTIHYKRAYDALTSAKLEINGDPGESYQIIREYFEKLKVADPSGSFSLETDPVNGTFERAHFAFGASLDAFRSCRPMLFMDGTFLKNKFKGTLLIAVAKDGNNGLVPIAFSIVRAEDTENWAAFMVFLRPLVSRPDLVFISDRHIGLINGVKNIFPQAHHSFCFRHIKGNLIMKLSGKDRKEALWCFEQCAKAPNVELFETYVSEFLRLGSDKAVDFLDNLPVQNFANAFFPGKRYGEHTSNAVESFNSWILQIRELPVAQVVDKLRLLVMTNTYDRSVGLDSCKTFLAPLRQIDYNEKYQQSRTWEVAQSSDTVFEILCDPRMMVDINGRTCSCGKWQIDGFPCVHAVRALSFSKPDNKYDYVEKYFYTSTLQAVYDSKIPALTTFCIRNVSGKEDHVLPPICKIPPGRPSTKRKLSQVEMLRAKIRCGRCNQMGYHNKRSCTVNL